MAIEFKSPLSDTEKDRLRKNIKEASSLMEKASIMLESETKLLEGRDPGEHNIDGTVFLIASYMKVKDSLGDFLGALLPGFKEKAKD